MIDSLQLEKILRFRFVVHKISFPAGKLIELLKSQLNLGKGRRGQKGKGKE